MNTTTAAEIHRRECYSLAGWMIDDDTPKPPEITPLDSAQCRRWARQEQPERAP